MRIRAGGMRGARAFPLECETEAAVCVCELPRECTMLEALHVHG